MNEQTLIDYYKAQYENTSPLSENEIIELIDRIKDQDEQAKQRLVGAHIKMIVSIASEGGKPTDDMIHEGIIGLFNAAKRYDPNKGSSFSSFAYLYIKHYIVEFMASFLNTVRIPSRKYAMMKKIEDAQIDAQDELGRNLTTSELSSLLKISEKAIINTIEETKFRKVSAVFDKPYTAQMKVFEEEKTNILNEALSQLSPRDEYVLRFKYGFGEDNPTIRTDKEIAEIFQCSPKYVLVIEERALNRLREYPGVAQLPLN